MIGALKALGWLALSLLMSAWLVAGVLHWTNGWEQIAETQKVRRDWHRWCANKRGYEVRVRGNRSFLCIGPDGRVLGSL